MEIGETLETLALSEVISFSRLVVQEVRKHEEEVSFRQTLHDQAAVEPWRTEVGQVRQQQQRTNSPQSCLARAP